MQFQRWLERVQYSGPPWIEQIGRGTISKRTFLSEISEQENVKANVRLFWSSYCRYPNLFQVLLRVIKSSSVDINQNLVEWGETAYDKPGKSPSNSWVLAGQVKPWRRECWQNIVWWPEIDKMQLNIYNWSSKDDTCSVRICVSCETGPFISVSTAGEIRGWTCRRIIQDSMKAWPH